jgi:hypothetical protein
MQWLRLYHDTINDPKWRVVANESRQPEANVLAVWMHMLVNASGAGERGTLDGWNDRIVAAGLGIPTDAVTAIRSAMQGLVLDGDKLTGWDKRQRASDDAGGRQRKTRERRETKPPGGGGHGGNGHDPEHSATVAGQTGNVARHSNGVAENPLRAQTPDLQKESKEESVCDVGVDPREAHTQAPPVSLPAKTNIVPFVKPSSREPLPDGWVLPDDWRAWAQEAGQSGIDSAAMRFFDFHSERGIRKTEAGWEHAWQRWITENIERGYGNGAGRNTDQRRGHGDLAAVVKSDLPGWFGHANGGSNPW